MKKTITPKTIALSVAGALILIGCFLPFIAGLKAGEIPLGRTESSVRVLFLVPAVILLILSAVSLGLTKRLARWQGIVAVLPTAFLLFVLGAATFHGKYNPTGFIKMFTDGDIGAKIIVIGTLAALVTALVTTVKPDPKLA